MSAQTYKAWLSIIPPVQNLDRLGEVGADLTIHRLDQSLPVASGNKAFKLYGHFLAAQRANKQHIVSFGGAWSNHLHALSYFAAQYQFRSTALVRGLYVDLDNAMLCDAASNGMRVIRLSKDDYARRRDSTYLAQLHCEYPDAWIVPEGGDDAYGRLGIASLACSLKKSIPRGDTLVVATGTGATVRGLAMGMKQHVNLVSALVLKDPVLADRLITLCKSNCPNFRLIDASRRGYGRVDDNQLSTLQSVLDKTGILLDPLYTGKAWQCALELAAQGERVHLLHSGGVQGWRGFLARGMLDNHLSLKKAVSSLDFSQ